MSALRKFSAIYEALMLRGKIRNKNQVLSYKKWAIKLMIFYADSLELKISKKVAWEIEKLEVLRGGKLNFTGNNRFEVDFWLKKFY